LFLSKAAYFGFDLIEDMRGGEGYWGGLFAFIRPRHIIKMHNKMTEAQGENRG